MRGLNVFCLTLAWATLSCAGCAGGGSTASFAARSHKSTNNWFTAAIVDNPVSKSMKSATKSASGWFKPGPDVSPGRVDPTQLSSKNPAPSADLFAAMGQVRLTHGDTEGALTQYNKALQQDKNHLESLLAVAYIHDRTDRPDEAVTYYRRAVASHPQSTRALNDLAMCYAAQQRYSESANALVQAIHLDPQKKLYRNNIAQVLVAMGRSEDAYENLAFAHGPAVASYNLGILLHQNGRDDEAVVQLQRALQHDPSLEQAQQWLAQLAPQPAAPNSQRPRVTVAQMPPHDHSRQPTASGAQLRLPPTEQPYADQPMSPPQSLAAPRAELTTAEANSVESLRQPNFAPPGQPSIAPWPGQVRPYEPPQHLPPVVSTSAASPSS